jgi:hypothetical protein
MSDIIKQIEEFLQHEEEDTLYNDIMVDIIKSIETYLASCAS